MVHFELITKAMKIFKFSNNLMIAVFVHPGEVDVESLAKFIASIQRDGGVDRTIKFARSPSDKLKIRLLYEIFVTCVVLRVTLYVCAVNNER